MNQDDIVRMARESGHGVQLDDRGPWGWMWNTNLKMMTDFANLVAAAERETVNAAVEQLNRLSDKYRQQGDIFGDSIKAAVAAEREACARMAEECVDIERLADDIRARGE